MSLEGGFEESFEFFFSAASCDCSSVMLQKKLVRRDERAQPHIYRAALSREKAGKKMLGELIEKVYEGSAMSLVLEALSAGKPARTEMVCLVLALQPSPWGGAVGRTCQVRLLVTH